MFLETLKQKDGLGTNDRISEQELEKIIKRDQVNAMIGNHLDRPDYEVKERYKYWKALNRNMNIVMTGMNQMGNSAGLGVFYV